MSNFEKLKQKTAWPDTTGVASFDFAVDGGGRELVIEAISKFDNPIMIEVGAFLCGSTLQWLRAHDQLRVIAIDPWYDGDGAADTLERYKNNPVFAPCFKKIDNRDDFIASVRQYGLYVSALANVRAYRDRVIALRAKSPDALMVLSSEWGIVPDIVYIDANKISEDLEVAYQLWPNAILCGDDWTWGPDQGYPMQTAVKSFAKRHGQSVEAMRATWRLYNK